MNSRGLLSRMTSNWPVKILSIVAAIALYLSYRIGSLQERFFSVPLAVVVSESYIPVGEVPRSARVSIRGVADEIFLILEDDIEAYIDLSGHSREGQFRVPVLVRKVGTAEGASIELKVEPLEVTVTLELRISRTLDLIPSIRGGPAEGFELTGYKLEPSSVEVIGPRSAVDSLNAAYTDEISLNGRVQDFSLRIRAHVEAPGVAIVGSDLVGFSGTVTPVVIARFFSDVAIRLIGLRDGLEATADRTDGSMRVRGRFFRINELQEDDVALTVDCSGIDAEGEYELAVIAIVPEGVEEISSQPTRLVVMVNTLESAEP